MTEKLTPTLRPETAFRRIAAGCAAAFADHLAQVMASDDPEGPHKARVALRRFRSALTGFAPVIDPAARREMAGQARELFRALGRLRDADVLLAGCLDPTAVAGLAADADRIRSEVRAEMVSMQAADYAGALTLRLESKDWLRQDKRGKRWHRRGLPRLARRALDRAWEACLAHGTSLADLAPETRHELRKELKTLRYLSEYFAPFWPGPKQDRFLAHLRALQESLGTLNDQTLAPVPPEPAVMATLLTNAAKALKALVKDGPWWS